MNKKLLLLFISLLAFSLLLAGCSKETSKPKEDKNPKNMVGFGGYQECAPGCPTYWIGDNWCDFDCYNDQCVDSNGVKDGGDCKDEYSGLCAPGCYDGWPGDNYCDKNCMNAACNFDNGDCGPQGAVCGDGKVDAGEECDDGNSVAYDQCNNQCEKAVCEDTDPKSEFGKKGIVTVKYGGSAAWAPQEDNCPSNSEGSIWQVSCTTSSSDSTVQNLANCPEGSTCSGGICEIKECVTFNDVESAVYKSGNQEYLIKVLSTGFVDNDWNKPVVQFEVNGKLYSKMNLSEHLVLSNNSYIKLNEIIHHSYAGGVHRATFCIKKGNNPPNQVKEVSCPNNGVGALIQEGETKTITLGSDYDVTNTFTHFGKTKLLINGLLTPTMKEGESFDLPVGSTSLNQVTYQEWAGGAHSAFVCISKDKAQAPLAKAIACPAGWYKFALNEGDQDSTTSQNVKSDILLSFVGSNEVQFFVNGQKSDKLKVGETFIFAGGKTKITPKEINHQDFAGGIHQATFCFI